MAISVTHQFFMFPSPIWRGRKLSSKLQNAAVAFTFGPKSRKIWEVQEKMSRTNPMRPINKYCFEANQKVSSSLRWSGIGIFTCLLAHYVGLSPARAAASAAYCTGVHRTAAGTAMDMHLHFLTTVSNWKALSCPCERIPWILSIRSFTFLGGTSNIACAESTIVPRNCNTVTGNRIDLGYCCSTLH